MKTCLCMATSVPCNMKCLGRHRPKESGTREGPEENGRRIGKSASTNATAIREGKMRQCDSRRRHVLQPGSTRHLWWGTCETPSRESAAVRRKHWVPAAGRSRQLSPCLPPVAGTCHITYFVYIILHAQIGRPSFSSHALISRETPRGGRDRRHSRAKPTNHTEKRNNPHSKHRVGHGFEIAGLQTR